MYKLYISLLGFSLIILTLVYCSKNDESINLPVDNDYRIDFEGNYNFTIYKTHWWVTDDTIGWDSYTDTLYTNGSINVYRTNQLLIKYDTGKVSGIWIDNIIDCGSVCIKYY
ncbi:MAG: hypothetical protein KAT68_02635 [Bacteroidales bacterium]|nr:hypothetical protein [Bacteroidales bacterium]